MPVESHSDTRFAERLAGALVARGVTSSKSVVNAIATVPRHAFLEAVYIQAGSQCWSRRDLSYERESDLECAYRDESHVVQTRGGLPSVVGTGPGVIAQMLETLDLSPGHRVLELGTGTGYSTGLISSMVEDPGLVTTVEIDEWAARTAMHNLNSVCMGDVDVIHESAVNGHPSNVPYDRVLANFSVRFIPTAWLDQLKDGGKLVTPGATTDSQHLIVLTRLGSTLKGCIAGPAAFPEMFQEENQPVQVVSMPWPKVEPIAGKSISLDRSQTQVLGSLLDSDYRFFHCLERPGHYLVDLTLGESMDPAEFRPGVVDPVDRSVMVGPMYEDPDTGTYGSMTLLSALVETHESWVRLGRPGVPDYVLAASRGFSSYVDCDREIGQLRKWFVPAGRSDFLDWEVRLCS